MKFPAAILLTAFIIAVPLTRGADESVGADLLRLSNGDLIHGSVAGWQKAGPLWRSAFASEPALFKIPGLDSILFAAHPIPASASASKHEVLLANGDLLPGTVISLDAKTLVLDTWYAGRLEIPRAMVRNISASGVIYEGPENMNGWVNGRSPDDKGWVFDDGSLSTVDNTATIGRDLKLPARSRIQFDLLPGGNVAVMVRFCFDRVDKPGSGYVFQIGATTADLAHETPDRPTLNLGQQATLETPATQSPAGGGDVFLNTVPMAPPVGRRHFDIRIDKDARKVWLFVDHKLAREFFGLEDLPKSGGGLLFSGGVSQNQGAPLRVSKIKVSRWGGGLDANGAGPDGSQQPPADGDEVKVVNNDTLHGKLSGIANGKIAFTVESSGSKVTLPMEELDRARLSLDTAAPQPVANPNALRAYLFVSGSVTMEIESWDGKRVVATSPDFGRAVFLPQSFKSVQFHPGDRPAGDDGDDEDPPAKTSASKTPAPANSTSPGRGDGY